MTIYIPMQDISLGVALGSASQISMFVVRILTIFVSLYMYKLIVCLEFDFYILSYQFIYSLST